MKIVLALIFVIIIILVLVISLGKPNEKIITDILVDNGMTINGSDSNIIHPPTNHETDHVSILINKEDIIRFEILESGYDFINRKYFCIFEFNAGARDQYGMVARALMLLHYDKGWKLSHKIGVLHAHYELDKYKQHY
jgi:hypothetical protein